MRDQDDSGVSTVKINLLLLQAFLSGVIAWYLWPKKLIDIGWGFLSFLLWVSAIGCSGRAFIEMLHAYKRDKKIEAILASGSKPKSSAVVSDDELDNAGMR